MQAWLLAQRLGAAAFMNRAVSHMYGGVGKHFPIFPDLLDFVWCATAVDPIVKDEQVKKEAKEVKEDVESDEHDVSPPPPYTSLAETSSFSTVPEGAELLSASFPSASPETASPAPSIVNTKLTPPPSPSYNHISPNMPPIHPSPLRKLLMDVMVVYWPTIAVHMVSRQPHQQSAWNALFDKHADLRRDFLWGLQGGVKMSAGGAYYLREVSDVGKGEVKG